MDQETLNSRPQKIRLRKCVRPFAFRFVYENSIDDLWKQLEAIYGISKKLGQYPLYEIESEEFTLRKSNGNFISVLADEEIPLDSQQNLEKSLNYT